MRDSGPASWVYIVECADHSYYTGSYRGADIATRIAEHNSKKHKNAYTAKRLPVRLVFAAPFEIIVEAIAFERQIKGWSRAKKEALIRGDYDALPALSQSRTRPNRATSS
ncbi:MAG: GIY-YIG nuclease family protein [Henriciella sp.]|uniref:GIY-YIG nuclease family protein n=1 Tax=Henriciella sp. TaxID=1968823 RepID=UPI003C756990